MSELGKDSLYVENDYDYSLQGRSQFKAFANSTGKFDELSSSAVYRSILAILLRVGFLLVQIGSVPVGNVNLILLQNIVDFCAVTIVYLLVGFIVAFTGDIAGVVGEGVWIGDSRANMNEAVVGWAAAVTASAICTCGIVGRMHTVGYLIVATLIGGILQPLLMHWAWTPRGWMATNSLTDRPVLFKDYAGGGLVHVVGGLSGFLGCVTLGRRILRLRDIDDASLPADSPGTAFAGYFLVLLGLQGLSFPVSDHETSDGQLRIMPYILVNNLLAASSSSLFTVGLHFALSREAFNYWTVMRCVQGAISGLVTVAAGVDLYSPLTVIGLSCASGLVFYLVSRRVYRSAIEDYCNIVATHLACGMFGSFLVPLCGRPQGIDGAKHALVLDMAWQVICLLALVLLVVLVMGPFFLILDVCGFLRNRSEFVNHLRASIALKRGPPRSYMQRLFFPDVESLYLQPGSLAKSGHGPQVSSPRLWRYQQEITMIEQTRSKQSGGNNLSEILEPSPVPVMSERVKKPRQIHTLRNSSPIKQFNAGGTGEVSESEVNYKESSITLRQDTVLGEQVTPEDMQEKLQTLEHCLTKIRRSSNENDCELLDRNSSGDLKCRSHKPHCATLHRTQKFTSLYSEQQNMRAACLHEKSQYCQKLERQSDFRVKVLLEPRRKPYASSDSEEEQSVERFHALKPLENLDNTI